MPRKAPKCPLNSKSSQELSRRGFELLQAGNKEAGYACHLAATSLPQANAYDFFHRGRAEQFLGKEDEAGKSFERAFATDGPPFLEPEAATEAYFQLGKMYRDQSDYPKATEQYLAAIKLSPVAPGAHVMLGVCMREMHRTEEAVHHYTNGLRMQPAIAAGQYNRAQALRELGREDEALAGYEATVTVDPTFAVGYEALGEALINRERYDEAEARMRNFAALQPDSASAYYHLGKVHFFQRRLSECVTKQRHALTLPPAPGVPFAYIHNDLGNAIAEISGRPDEVFHHYSEAARLMPRFAEALSNVGTGYKERGRHAEAAHNFERAIGAKPTLCEAYKNLGSSYGEIDGRLPEAVGAFEGALRINSQFWPALYALLDTKQFLCDWRGRHGLLQKLTHHLHDLHTFGARGAGPDDRMHGGLAPFQIIPLMLPPATFLAVSHRRAHKDIALRRRRGLAVLCFGADSSEKRHDGTELRRQLAALCTEFYDLSEFSDAEMTTAINEQRPHLLVNLVGHTAGSRHVVTQWQPAPVQAMHYGYPATTALPAMGYMLTDRVATPPAFRELGLGPLGSRDDYLALCNFNQLYKMDPETFDAWANALRRLPRSFLWLTRVSVRKDTSLYAEANLIYEARALGIDANRLAFSFRYPEQDYVAFRALADLMVDNRAYNAHTTGADTLWAAVPAVLLEGRHLAGRAGVSFATAIGGASMITTSMRAYEDATHQLGASPGRLRTLRRRLMRNRDETPLFNLDRLAQGQHRLASLMWGVYAAGNLPMHVIAAR